MKIRKMGKKGFTLMELMVVLALIAMIAAFAQPKYVRAMGKAKLTDAANVLKIVAANVEASCAVNGTKPTSVENYATTPMGFKNPTASGECSAFQIDIIPATDDEFPKLCIKRVSESTFRYSWILGKSTYKDEDMPIPAALVGNAADAVTCK